MDDNVKWTVSGENSCDNVISYDYLHQVIYLGVRVDVLTEMIFKQSEVLSLLKLINRVT